MKLFYWLYKILPVSVRWVLSYLSQPKYLVGVTGIIFYDHKILLVKPVYQYSWCLPGGFIRKNESVEQALKREILEETGLPIIVHKIIEVVVTPKRRTIDVIILGCIRSDQSTKKTSEIEQAGFYHPDNLPDNLLWLHEQLLSRYFIKNKVALLKECTPWSDHNKDNLFF